MIVDAEFELLLHWIREREAVRKAKDLGGPKPWTSDRLLRDYRWCNVRRMDDRVSGALMRDWYQEGAAAEQLVAAALARLVNWPDALLEATGGKAFSLDHLAGIAPALHARAGRGEKVFTGAYVIPGVPGRNKIDSILDVVADVEHHAGEIFKSTLQATWQELIRIEGLGSFLAGQITADLAHLSSGATWLDRFEWAPVGPGSARGINRLHGRPKTQALPQTRFDIELRDYMNVVRPRIAEIDCDRSLGAQDYQGTLCEFDKYRRLQLAEGTVRARYDGAAQEALLL